MKNNYFTCFILSVLGYIYSSHSFSQTNNPPYIPSVVPPSPNASALQKFGNFPVSPYTGTTDVSIPMYTITARGLNLPIELDYHTGGVKLSEESGWVGLGWALNAGGMISKTINDKDDFNSGYFNDGTFSSIPEPKGLLLPHPVWGQMEYLGDWGYDYYCRYNVYTETGIYYYFNALNNIFYSPASFDLEPDTYNFSFLGRTGKFIMGRDKKIVLQKQENLKIDFSTDWSSVTITDEKGNKYYFSDIEYSESATGGQQHISSWLLSKVVTQQQEVINFNYSTDNTWTTVQGTVHETVRNGVPNYEGSIYSNDPGETYLNKTLQSIDFTNGEIQFSFDGNRNDLQNGKKLNSIKIYSKDQNNNLTYLRQDKLFYSYFNDSYSDNYEFWRLRLDSVKEISGNLSMPAYVFSYNMPNNNQGFMGKHYSSVDHWGYFNGIANGLNVGTGINYKIGFTPGFTGWANIGGPGGVMGQLVTFSGANREPNFSYAKACSLGKISYPTGGYTIFNYEANDYDYYNSQAGYGGHDFENVPTTNKTAQVFVNKNGDMSGTVDFSDIYLSSSAMQTPVATLSIAFQALNSDSLNYYHKFLDFGKANFTFQNNISDVTDASLLCSGQKDNNNNCSGTVYTATRNLVIQSPGVYSWSAHIDPSISMTNGFSQIIAIFTYAVSTVRENTILTGGGIRIKSVSDYLLNGSLAKKKTYDYGYQRDKDGDGTPESYSYGRLLSFLSYARIEPTKTSNGAYGESLTRYSSSISSLTSLSSGNVVGYDTVTEYTTDSVHNSFNGKTLYAFYNSADTTFTYAGYRLPGISNLPNNLNGLLKSKSDFISTGSTYNPISSLKNYYRSANRIIYDAFKYQHFDDPSEDEIGGTLNCAPYGQGGPPNRACTCPVGIDSATYGGYANFYPAISSEVILLDSTVTRTWDENNATNQITIASSNFYDNPAHYLPTRTVTTNSKGEIVTTHTSYPLDYNVTGYTSTVANGIAELQNTHIINAPVENYTQVSNSDGSNVRTVSGSIYNYRSDIPKPASVYVLHPSAPVTGYQPLSMSGSSVSMNSAYQQDIFFDQYDAYQNLTQQHKANDLTDAYMWGYQHEYPIASAKNAAYNEIYTSSFEDGGWDTNMGYDNTHVHSGDQSGYMRTTTSSEIFSYATIRDTLASDAPAKYFHYSGWIYSNGPSAQVWLFTKAFGETAYYTVADYIQTTTTGQWVFLEKDFLVPANTQYLWMRVDNNGNGKVWFDDLRFRPSNAQMTTYTYEPLIGMTSQSDENNRLTSFSYDGLGRLSLVRDKDSNILKKYLYAYQSPNPDTASSCVTDGNCSGPGKKCVFGYCQKAKRINTSTVKITTGANAGKWQCNYYYQWSNNTTDPVDAVSAGTRNSEYNSLPCDITYGNN